ncbi:hypothetical protein Z043_110781 [Scleropages formosus]|uniref:Hypoxia-inducible factor 1-alpha n=1 Tax=Scleropages formosus TaxID=113540 RepID=A0A0P7VB99_SCLFO|nr:hypothetical protein Z043_110781 [Scleropages formosus]
MCRPGTTVPVYGSISTSRSYMAVLIKLSDDFMTPSCPIGRLSSEWRRARSRASARSRRERESQLFRELAGALPSAPGPAGHMDKASLIRLTLTYLRLREILDDLGHMQSRCNSGTTPCDEKVLDSALGGFMLLVSHSGQVIYATGAVTAHTGINQMDLIGQSLFQFMHPSDLREMREILSSKTGYTETELLGQSVYRYYHALDCEHILKTHLSLFSKGKVSTGKYRLLVKNGGFVWVETNATVVYSSRSGQPQSVICINYILSEVEQPDVLFSLEQKEYLLKPIPCSSITASSLSPQGSGYRGCSEFTAEESVPSPVHETGDRMETEHTVPITETLLELDREDIPEEAAQEFSEEDLDTLAPYIPMDGEDFLLSPISEEVDDKADMGQQGCYLDCFVLPCFDVQSYAKADSNCNSPGPCEPTNGYERPLGFVPWAPQYSDPLSSPPDRSSIYSGLSCPLKAEWTGSVLPVLSPLECEVNAPVDPASCLLRGPEIISVLDQATYRFCP